MKTSLKKIFLLMAVVMTAMVCFAFSACAKTYEDFEYSVYNDKISIMYYTGFAETVVIPDVIDGMSVTSIDENAFRRNLNFKNIIIPDSINYIDSYAFYRCENLESVTIGDGLKRIGRSTFEGCSALKSVKLGDNFVDVGDYAFSQCTKLEEIKLPDSMERIGFAAFSQCSSLKNIVIPSNITTIEGSAFSHCTNLECIIIPNGITVLDTNLFYDCTNLETISIPDCITEIKGQAFYNCINLKNITIPKNVTAIGYSAFYNCKSLEKVNITDIDAWCELVFSNEYSTPLLFGAELYLNGELLTEVTIPESVTSIGYYAFAYCKSLKSIVIPVGITNIGVRAFYLCDNLQHICFKGSKKQWNNISKANDFPTNISEYLHLNFKPEVDIKEEFVYSSCLKQGEKTVSCSCGFFYRTEILPLANCSFTVYESDNNATCVSDGTKTSNCDYGCGKKVTITDKNSARGHNYIDIIIPATCITQGFTKHMCACKEYYIDEYTDRLEHRYTEYNVIESTHSNSGKIFYVCSCGDNYTETVPVKPHIYTIYTTAATLTKNGTKAEKCSCGAVKSSTTIYYPKTIKLSATTFTYNGKTKTPSVIVKDSKGNALKNGTDYTVTYPKKRKSIGKYTVTVTFKGNYSGTKKLSFEIVPAKATLSKVTAGSKRFTANWKTVSGVTGYEVVYSTSKKFTKKTTKTITIKKAKTKKTTIKKLSKGKKYYVKVRAYKTVNGKKIYGAFSSVKNVKVK